MSAAVKVRAIARENQLTLLDYKIQMMHGMESSS